MPMNIRSVLFIKSWKKPLKGQGNFALLYEWMHLEKEPGWWNIPVFGQVFLLIFLLLIKGPLDFKGAMWLDLHDKTITKDFLFRRELLHYQTNWKIINSGLLPLTNKLKTQDKATIHDDLKVRLYLLFQALQSVCLGQNAKINPFCLVLSLLTLIPQKTAPCV